MYSCVFSCEFIDLVDFLAPLCDPCHSIHNTAAQTSIFYFSYDVSAVACNATPTLCEKAIYIPLT